jgi:PemK-like, MazF-like toxin of type II toxin-antitoxin system
VICPITSRVRDYPFEAMLPDSASFRGVVLADQPRSISWEKRPVKHAGRAPDIVLTEVRERLAALLGNRLNSWFIFYRTLSTQTTLFLVCVCSRACATRINCVHLSFKMTSQGDRLRLTSPHVWLGNKPHAPQEVRAIVNR